MPIVSRCAEPFRNATTASRLTASLSSRSTSSWRSGLTVHDARVVAGEQLEREERRATASRAHVLEPAAQQLGLLPEAELADRPVGDRAHAEVLGAGVRLDVLVPLRPQLGELALGPRLGERVGLGGCLGEGHSECAGSPI
jgi:hypothetical protein